METSEIEKILHYLCEELGGDWFLTGGALVRLEFDPERGTEDLDLVRIRHSVLSDEASRNALFSWLMSWGSGPEWVNSAVEPFLRQVPGWESHLIQLRSGTKGRVFRPDVTLFALLKLNRGTDVDQRDVETALARCPSDEFDEKTFRSWASEATQKRFQELRRPQK